MKEVVFPSIISPLGFIGLDRGFVGGIGAMGVDRGYGTLWDLIGLYRISSPTLPMLPAPACRGGAGVVSDRR